MLTLKMTRRTQPMSTSRLRPMLFLLDAYLPEPTKIVQDPCAKFKDKIWDKSITQILQRIIDFPPSDQLDIILL